MEEEKDGSSFDLDDYDHEIQKEMVREGREVFKESNPELYAVLNKYKNHNVNDKRD